MKPDRSNYEVWFIDWLDGRLNESQIAELQGFLRENPDLKEELEMLPFLEVKPDESEYQNKKRLMKTSENYSASQFEYLCIAYLENDLTPEQSAELMQIISRDEERRREFDLTCRLKLTPGNISFPEKLLLKRLTIPQRIFRYSSIGLTAAAAVALLITVWVFLRPDRNPSGDITAAVPSPDTLVIGYSPAFYQSQAAYGKVENIRKSSSHSVPDPIKTDSAESGLQTRPTAETGTLREPVIVDKVEAAIPAETKLITRSQPNTIAAFNPGIMPPTFDPHGRRSNVDRFMARFFHEKLMKDKAAGDRPVGSYELAEAGIKGLNKLLRWEITLPSDTENKDRK